MTVLVTDVRSEKPVAETRTDGQGRFRFSLRPGTYRMLARDDRLGACSPALKTIQAIPGKPVEVDLTVYILAP